MPLEKANVVMVTDSLENIQKIERLLKTVDQPRQDSLKPKFYALKNGAKASDVVTKIKSMLSGPSANQLRSDDLLRARRPDEPDHRDRRPQGVPAL